MKDEKNDPSKKSKKIRAQMVQEGMDNFDKLYTTLLDKSKVDLVNPPELVLPGTPREIRAAIEDASCRLPLGYRDKYVKPLLENFDAVNNLSYAQNLFGAVYDHNPNSPIVNPSSPVEKHVKLVDQVQRFLAINSNLYRSFLDAKRRRHAGFPIISELPPLAAFQREIRNVGDLVPTTLPVDKVKRLCGGEVSVVVLPSSYLVHPIFWSILAHETAGHAVFHADPELLPELEKKLREHLRKIIPNLTEIASGQEKLTPEQVLNLLWLYWLEETAAHVYGVLNIGPSFGKALAVWLALWIQQYLVESLDHLDPFTLNEREQEFWVYTPLDQATLIEATKAGTKKPTLIYPISQARGAKPRDIDSHPFPIFQLHVVIGAINALDDKRLDPQKRQDYIDELDGLAKRYEGQDWPVDGFLPKDRGDVWIEVHQSIPFNLLKDSARAVGEFIANVKLDALGKNKIQALETWDDFDQAAAEKIRDTLFLSSTQKNCINNKGDDAQLLAGALLAFFGRPTLDFYQQVNERLQEALTKSFKRDEIWGDVAYLKASS